MSYIYKRGRYWWYGRGKIQQSTKATDKTIAQRIQHKWDNDYALKRAGITVLDKI